MWQKHLRRETQIIKFKNAFHIWINIGYICERTLSVMPRVKSHVHVRLTDCNLQSQLHCAVTSFRAEFRKIDQLPTASGVGMGTETRYLIGLGAKLWKTGVSISSDVNGSVIGTGEIMKTHIHLLLLYIYTHYLANSIPPESPAVFICNNIQTLVYDAFLLFPIQKGDRSHVDEFQHAQHESPVYDRRVN